MGGEGHARGQLTHAHTLCNKPSNRANTHMHDDRDPSVVRRADTHFIQNVMVHSGFEVIFPTGQGVLLVCGDPLVFLLRARSSLCRSSLPRSSLSRSSLPRERRPGACLSSPWRCRKQPSRAFASCPCAPSYAAASLLLRSW